MAFSISSPAFKPGQSIPSKYTCDAADVSPPLQWHDAPKNTQSLVLIVDDIDAPAGVWDHWIVFNIPASVHKLNENLQSNLPTGALPGKNSWGKAAYGGPCPPQNEHRYYFRLFALDSNLNLAAGADRKQIESAMDKHVIEQTEIMAKYKRGT